MTAALTTQITPKYYKVMVFVNEKLIKGAIIRKRLKFILLSERWQQQVNQYNEILCHQNNNNHIQETANG